MPDRLTVNWWLIRDWDAAAGAPIWANAESRTTNTGQCGTGELDNGYTVVTGPTCDSEYYVRMRARIQSPRLDHRDDWTHWSDPRPLTSYNRDRSNQQSVQQYVQESGPESSAPQSAVLEAVTIKVPAEANVEPALTVSAANLPLSHGGREFSFELHFSENVKMGFLSMRDGVFDVTITLPATRSCSAPGAVCAHSGQKLSEGLVLRVGGPGG